MVATLFTQSKQQKALILKRKLQTHGHWVETYVPTIYFALTGFGHYVLGLPIFAPFYTLQYAVEVHDTTSTSYFAYGCGWRDIPLLISLFFGWTLVRAIAMHRLLRPWASKRGIRNHTKLDRFAEQSWQAAFYLMTWISSTYLILSNPEWLDGRTSWQNFPYSNISMQAKLHCLGILMFWLLQLVTVHTEQRRKDHTVMVVHHIVTITLIAGCYVVYATPFILVIAWCMDLADVFLSMAKSANYIKCNGLADTLFGLFAISWFVTRHGYYIYFLYSAYRYPFSMNKIRWDPTNDHYIMPALYYFFYSLLLCLQILCIYWSALLISAIKKKITGNGLSDCRSDDEEIPCKDKSASITTTTTNNI